MENKVQGQQSQDNIIQDPKEMGIILDKFRLGVNDSKDALTNAVANVTNMCAQLISTFAAQKERIEVLEKTLKENDIEVPPLKE